MFQRIMAFALALAGAALSVVTVFKFGKSSGKQEAKQRETERRLKSKNFMKDVQYEIETMDDDHIINTLNRFVRK